MEFQWILGLEGRKACRAVRKRVFVEEQKFSEELEFDAADAAAWHLCVNEAETPIAAARLFQEESGGWHCGRICALPAWRGKGLGLRVMEEIARKARELGASELELSAQCQAAVFYEKAGYSAYGESYLDEHCPHVSMKRLL